MKSRSAICGINLGGWLVVEKWMTPSLFRGINAVDEHSLSQTAEGRRRIVQHRKSFITEDDFVWMATHRVKLVRIPVGYWLFQETDEYVGGLTELDWAMHMAELHGLQVLLDLHGLPGSQNGKMHSGKQGEKLWYAEEKFQRRSLELCEITAKRYGNSAALWGIEIINEPIATSWREQVVLRRYYRNAYKSLDKILPQSIYIVFSDAFMPLLMAGALLGKRAMMDVHWYSFGTNWQKYDNPEQYFRKVQRRARMLKFLQLFHPVIIGEWNMMLEHGARERFAVSPSRKMSVEHYRVQKAAYERAVAHTYWSYKAEHEGSWNYRNLVEQGLISEVEK